MTARLDTGWYRSKLPEVRIAGATEPERFVLVGGHYCAWHEGVTDNATGDACILEMAKLLWQERAQPRPLGAPVLVAGPLPWPLQRLHVVRRHVLHRPGRTLHRLLQHRLAGREGRHRVLCRNTCAEFEGYCRAVIETVTGQANAPVFRPARAADQSFLASGMPSFSAYPFLADGHPDKRPWTGGCGNAWWWHTEHDTLDKADETILATDVRVGLEAVWGLATASFLPLDYRATGA